MMATLEQSLDILDKMLKQQRLAKQLLGDQYYPRVSTYIEIVKAVMGRDNSNEVVAVMKICEDPEVSGNGLAVALLMSAALEISKTS